MRAHCWSLVLLATSLPAQVEQLLFIERPEDRAERNQVERALARLKTNAVFEEATPKDLVQLLNTVLAGSEAKTMFVLLPKVTARGEVEPLTLNLRNLSILNILAVVQRLSPLRFVYRSGVVLVTLKDDVKELTFLQLYDVRAGTFKLRDFPGPRIGITLGEDPPVEEEPDDAGRTPSGFDNEGIERLIREQVEPRSWDSPDGGSIASSNGILVVRQTERAHLQIQKLLRTLGIPAGSRQVRIPGPALEKPVQGR
jgi:hypothetical protein